MSTETTVAALPTCDVCKALQYDEPKEASYDARTRSGQWAFLCEDHFELHGLGKLGVGFGQRLVLKEAGK
jgi:hypothetical protein